MGSIAGSRANARRNHSTRGAYDSNADYKGADKDQHDDEPDQCETSRSSRPYLGSPGAHRLNVRRSDALWPSSRGIPQVFKHGDNMFVFVWHLIRGAVIGHVRSFRT
jgi:hypothetical protein